METPDIIHDDAVAEDDCFIASKGYLQAYNNDSNIEMNEQIKPQNGSIVKLNIDLNNEKVEYFVDDKSVGCIKKSKHGTYVIGIYLYCVGTKIQLLP